MLVENTAPAKPIYGLVSLALVSFSNRHSIQMRLSSARSAATFFVKVRPKLYGEIENLLAVYEHNIELCAIFHSTAAL